MLGHRLRLLEAIAALRAQTVSPEILGDTGRAAGQGRRREAGELLAPVYLGFTEGFDTVDLKEAEGMLRELG